MFPLDAFLRNILKPHTHEGERERIRGKCLARSMCGRNSDLCAALPFLINKRNIGAKFPRSEKKTFETNKKSAVVVDPLEERSPPPPVVRGSKLVFCKLLC